MYINQGAINSTLANSFGEMTSQSKKEKIQLKQFKLAGNDDGFSFRKAIVSMLIKMHFFSGGNVSGQVLLLHFLFLITFGNLQFVSVFSEILRYCNEKDVTC